MSRFFISLLIGLGLGAAIGLYMGWVQFPVVVVGGYAENLAPNYKDDYTVMVASGFMLDQDAVAAVERLRVLRVENVPIHVQEVTERYITASRNVEDIYVLVALSEGLGRLTSIMEPYRLINQAGANQ